MHPPEEPHYYASGYGVDNDPYAQENGVLKNLLGLVDTRELNEIEADLAGVEITRLLGEPLPPIFGTVHLQALHREIFHRVYPWAGEFRQVGIGKGDTLFLAHAEVPAALGKLFEQMEQQFPQGVSAKDFSEQAAPFLVRLNHIHPFREGNGRTQRLFLTQLAQRLGLSLDWSSVGNEAMRRACIDGIGGEIRAMVRLILLNTKSL